MKTIILFIVSVMLFSSSTAFGDRTRGDLAYQRRNQKVVRDTQQRQLQRLLQATDQRRSQQITQNVNRYQKNLESAERISRQLRQQKQAAQFARQLRQR